MGGFGGVDQAGRGGHRFVIGTGERSALTRYASDDCMGVATACELGAAPVDTPFGLADGQIRIAKHGLAAERHLFVAATGD